jgi:magnesium transporter
MLDRVRPEDVAIALRSLTPDERFIVFEILNTDFPQAVTEVLTELEPQDRQAILEELGPEKAAALLQQAPVDDAVYLLDKVSPDLKEQILEAVDRQEGPHALQQHLSYEEDSAGRVMDTEYVALRASTTVGDAIGELRRIARDVEMISYLYVVDDGGHLMGVTPLRRLLLANPDDQLGEVMNSSVIKVHTGTDQEEVAQMAARYDLLAIPVTDDDNKLAGIVTIDDILDIFKDEATEDFYKMAGTSDDEMVYQDHAWKVLAIRLPWILFNLVGLLLAGLVSTQLEKTFNLAILIGFIPVVMGMAGNVGTQTATIAVRGLATGRIGLDRDSVRQFLWQQTKVGMLMGLSCSALVAGVAYLFSHDVNISLAVSSALLLTMFIAAINGALIPMLFQRLGFDAAVASGPLVTTVNDLLGLLFYFGLSYLFLKGFSF